MSVSHSKATLWGTAPLARIASILAPLNFQFPLSLSATKGALACLRQYLGFLGGCSVARNLQIFSPLAAQSLIDTLGGAGTGEPGGGALGTHALKATGSRSRRVAQARCGRPGARQRRRRGCSCSGSPTAGAAAAATELSAWAARLRAVPWRSAPPGGQELRPGAPQGPCCCGCRGGGSSPGRQGAREIPREPRALAPCDPPYLLPGLGLHSLLAEPPAVATGVSDRRGGGDTRESSARAESAP